MLQQTTVKAVVPYFEAFTARWPDIEALAAAKLDDVLAAWAGLGYYSRARNLHACAGAIVRDHNARFPLSEKVLLELPGVGPYTAAAITSIGHGLKATPVDGNIERVVARLFAVQTPLPTAKAALRNYAQTLTPERRAGDFAQAMMDLGATICTPRSPSCLVCPLSQTCLARAQNIAADLPRKAAKAKRPNRYGTAFVVTRPDGSILLRQRPPTGLLGGMLEVPSTDWTEINPGSNAVRAAEPVEAEFKLLTDLVVHVFTHFRLELTVRHTCVPTRTALNPSAGADRCRWIAPDALSTQALPSVMLKVLAAAGIDQTRAKPRAGKPKKIQPVRTDASRLTSRGGS